MKSSKNLVTTVTNLAKEESRPFFLGDKSIWSFPSWLFPLAIAVLEGPEGYCSRVIIAFGAFEFIVPQYYNRIGKMKMKESSLV